MPEAEFQSSERAPPGEEGRGGAEARNAPELASAHAENERLRAAVAAGRERERALFDELQHRVRNMLAMIRSVYRQSLAFRGSEEDFAQHFQGRLDAIARHYSYVGDGEVAGVEIEDLLRDELLQTRYLDGPRCTINGPAVVLRGERAALMGLAIHELATNAVKFGALGQTGTLLVEWSVGPEGLQFHWSERGVPVAAPAPRRTGFGRQVIEQALPYQLGATTSFELKPGGLECRIGLPLPDGASRHANGGDQTGLPSTLPTDTDDLPCAP